MERLVKLKSLGVVQQVILQIKICFFIIMVCNLYFKMAADICTYMQYNKNHLEE